MKNFDGKILAFSHIPKTAGSSINYLLRRYFGSSLMAVRSRKGQNSPYQFSDFVEDSGIYPKLSCISGHPLKPFVDFGLHERNFNWFTFFRDPEKRFISHYIHQQTGNESEYKMDLARWAKKYNRSNIQVRWIAGEEDLEAAKQILDAKFQIIGITEEFEESVAQLRDFNRLFGFSCCLKKRKMVARSHEIRKATESDSGYNQIIEDNNALDRELYSYALDRFSDQSKKIKQLNDNLVKEIRPRRELKFLEHWFNLFSFQLRDKIQYAPSVREE